jgi:hypothetical protein
MSFTTTYKEIAKVLGKKNPWAASTKEAVFKGLTRLNDCRMTLTNEKGLRTLGGILTGAREELEEDSSLEIRIHLDRDFVELIDEGYTQLDPDIYFKSTPVQANLYLFLRHQREFSNNGRLERPISIFKIYEYAGLGGINSERPDKYKRRIIKKGLEGLKKRSIIGSYSIKNDLLEITPKKNEKQALTEKKTEYSQIISLIKNAFGEKPSWTDFKIELCKVEKFLEHSHFSFDSFIKEYLDWLENKKRIDFIVPTIFNPNNTYFQEFYKIQKNNSYEESQVPERIKKLAGKYNYVEEENED